MDHGVLRFESRRPVIIAPHAAAAGAQPQAVQVAIDILKRGGNAADAAVAMAAVLNVAQPTSTGLGGDTFCLFYDASTRSVKGLNGSGRSPSALTLDKIQADGFSEGNPLPVNHGHTMTVPGTPAAWIDTLQMFGSKKLDIGEILQPAIDFAENGIPVVQVASWHWNNDLHLLLDKNNPHGTDLTLEGRAPKWGEPFTNQHLANSFRELVKHGKAGFYEGRIAQSIVDSVHRSGGVMSLENLKNHKSSMEEPIGVDYKGVRLWENAPNGQGIVALMALNILKGYDLKEMGHNSVQYLHTLIEAIRLGFSDALEYLADPSKAGVPVDSMLSQEYAAERRKFIQQNRAMSSVPHTQDMSVFGSDTVYMTVVDEMGNACSFINSNFRGFGTGVVPRECGFTLQNRGINFSLKKDHPNCVAPNKRTFHTIIPAMLTDSKTGELLSSFGIMGGFMQPQAHVQVLLNMLEFGMNPQEALDKPRFCVGSSHQSAIGSVQLEVGIPQPVISGLEALGHNVKGPVQDHARFTFGRGHVITKGAWWLGEGRDDVYRGRDVLWAGSDGRTDGLALGY